jgi:TrmH family RNA methyltransferase
MLISVTCRNDMTNDPPRDNFHVVLVEPENSLNIGAVARAMMNLGFRHLHLVAPIHFDRDQTVVTARNAETLLDSALVHATFEEAIADMEEVVGLALRKGTNPAHFVTLDEWTGALPNRPFRKTALVFGPENNGLRQEHLNQCRWVIRIPSHEEFSAFNLSQSVLLTLYDISRVLPDDSVLQFPRPDAEPPTWNDYFHLDRHLDAVMAESGFIRNGSPTPGPSVVKNLFRRLELNQAEMRLLLALFSRVHSSLQRNPKEDVNNEDRG